MSAVANASVNPDHHMCGRPGEISYEQVNDGMIWCRVCGRIWDLTEHGWKPDPPPPMSPAQIAAMNKRRYGNKRR